MASREKSESLGPIPEQFAKMHWAPTHWLKEEGGEWLPLSGFSHLKALKDVKAIRYANGWIYDFIVFANGMNPWRHFEDS